MRTVNRKIRAPSKGEDKIVARRWGGGRCHGDGWVAISRQFGGWRSHGSTVVGEEVAIRGGDVTAMARPHWYIGVCAWWVEAMRAACYSD